MAYRNGTSTTLTANTWFSVPLTGEDYDTDGFHDNSTNNTRFTIPTGKGGKYLLTFNARFEEGTDYAYLDIVKNNTGSLVTGWQGLIQFKNLASNNWLISGATVATLAAADYVEFRILNQLTRTAALYVTCSATLLGV